MIVEDLCKLDKFELVEEMKKLLFQREDILKVVLELRKRIIVEPRNPDDQWRGVRITNVGNVMILSNIQN